MFHALLVPDPPDMIGPSTCCLNGRRPIFIGQGGVLRTDIGDQNLRHHQTPANLKTRAMRCWNRGKSRGKIVLEGLVNP